MYPQGGAVEQVPLLSGTEGGTYSESGGTGGFREGGVWEDRAVLTKICRNRICPYVDCMLGEV